MSGEVKTDVVDGMDLLRAIADHADRMGERLSLRDISDELRDAVDLSKGGGLDTRLAELEDEELLETGEMVVRYAGVPVQERYVKLTDMGADLSGKFDPGLISGKGVRKWVCPDCGDAVWLGKHKNRYVLCNCSEGMWYMESTNETREL